MDMLATTSELATVPQWSPLPTPVVKSPTDYTAVGETVILAKTFIAEVKARFKVPKQKADEAHKAICEFERETLAPALEYERRGKAAIIAYEEEQERARRAEELRLQEEARKAEEARRLEEAANLEREAARTGDASLHAEAEAVLNDPLAVPTVVVPSSTPKVAGISKPSYTYSARVVRPEQFLDYVFSQPALRRGLVSPDQKALDRLADALREQFHVPGVELVKTPRLAVRR